MTLRLPPPLERPLEVRRNGERLLLCDDERIVADPNSASGLSTVYQGTLEPVQALPQVFRANTVGDGVQDSVAIVPPGGAIPAAVLIVPRRNQGPILTSNPAAGTAISVHYAGFSGTREMQAFRSINRARNLSQFTAALQSFDVGSQNFIYADTGGNIAYFATGEMPLRGDLENGAPVGLPPFLICNGQGGNEWLPAQDTDPERALPFAILPFSEMPQLVNPPRGFIATANNNIHPPGYARPVMYQTASTGEFDRITRLLQMISGTTGTTGATGTTGTAGAKFTLDDHKRMQLDTLHLRAQSELPLFRGWTASSPDVERARAMLASWDARLERDSAAAALHASWRAASSACSRSMARWWVSSQSKPAAGVGHHCSKRCTAWPQRVAGSSSGAMTGGSGSGAARNAGRPCSTQGAALPASVLARGAGASCGVATGDRRAHHVVCAGAWCGSKCDTTSRSAARVMAT